MIVEYGPYFNPACDVCGHMLPAVIVQRRRVTAAAAEAARTKARAKMAADGWTSIPVVSLLGKEEEKLDVCALCVQTGRWLTKK